MAIRLAPSDRTGSADAIIDRERRFDRVLLELSMSDAVTSGNLGDALREICDAASRALDVRRTNVWLFDAAGSRLRQAAAEQTACETAAPAEIGTEDNPPYFAALQQQRIIAADDVYTDPRTMRFADGYLRPRGITSTLDAAVRLHGRLLGVICHEHVGPSRTWDPEEERFAASLGDLVALAFVADEQAAAQRALRESEARLRLVIDGLRDLIFTLDDVGTVTSLNPALESLLGWTRAVWVGQHFAGLIFAEDLPRALDLFSRAVAGQDVPTFEIRMRDAAGQPVWFEFTVSVERDGQNVRSVFGVGREIAERKQAEARRRVLAEVGQALARCGDDVDEALRVVNEQIASAVGCARIATVLCDPASGAILKTAPSTESAAEIAHRGEHDAFPPLALVERTIECGETSVVHGHANDPATGGSIPTATAACALRSPDGVIGVIALERIGAGGFDGEQIDLLERVGHDLVLALAAVRRRREAREDAEVSAALARVGHELITSVDLPLLLDRLCRVTAEVLDCDASYTFLRDEVQRAFVRTASYGETPQLAEALGAVPVLDDHTPGLAEALVRDRVVIARAGDGIIAGPLWDAYGTSSAAIIALSHGSQLVGAQAVAFRGDRGDFGPRHLRIAHGIAQLASLAIANAHLVGELEAAGRIKSDFVATMSHELRTPLNVILGYCDLLLLEEFGSLESEQSDTLRRVRASAAELQELIEATLDLSRLESGAVALRLESVDLEAWLREVKRETASVRESKPQLAMRWDLQIPAHPVPCDALKLKVILKNLIANAIKFTHEGSVDVTVTVRDGTIAMSVRDSGIGMSAEVRAVIFEAFRQGDASMTRPYGGVGLGLYIVARLIDALHGRIEVESVPGTGSTFRVEIPIAAADANR